MTSHHNYHHHHHHCHDYFHNPHRHHIQEAGGGGGGSGGPAGEDLPWQVHGEARPLQQVSTLDCSQVNLSQPSDV